MGIFAATSFFGDTTAGQAGRLCVAGGRRLSLPDRTCRPACPITSNSNRNYEAIGIAGWRFFFNSRFRSGRLLREAASSRAISVFLGSVAGDGPRIALAVNFTGTIVMTNIVYQCRC
jgi:hypothetical protein